jgi:hypothetical protein
MPAGDIQWLAEAISMKHYKDMTRFERSITDSVRNGWNVSGEYVALSGDGDDIARKTFESDSIGSLVLDIYRWYSRELYANRQLPSTAGRLLVKQLRAL